MFQKVFEYAGPHKKGLYAATVVVLVSVLMGVLPFVLAYQVIAPLVMGAELDASFLILRVALVLVCLVLQAVLYGWGLNLSHKAAYDTLEAGAAVPGLHPYQPDRHDDHVLGWHEENGALLYGRPEDEQHYH